MWRVLRWMMVVFLCCAAGGDAGVEPMDARLQEAQSALDEAWKLKGEGKYTEAIPKAEHALTLREAVLGGTHLKVADCLSDLGGLYWDLGKYARAEPLYQRALAIREQALGKHHPQIAGLLSELANLYRKQGLPGQAEPLLQRSLAILEQAPGEHQTDTAQTLNSLAVLYLEQGLYSRAEPLLQRALAIREQALGKHHTDTAQTLHGLASLYLGQRLYSQAEPLLQRALSIWEASLGKHHPNLTPTLDGLAFLYKSQGLYSRAEPLYQRSLAISEAALGKHHPRIAFTLSGLAVLYLEQGLHSRAEPLFQRALTIWEGTLGKDHYRVAGPLNHLANLYRDQGLYSRAAPLYERTLATLEATFGTHHPFLAQALNDFARLHLAQHRLTETLPLLTRAFSLSEQRLRREALGLSEARLDVFLQHLRAEEEHLYALLRAHPRNPSVQRMALSSVLLRKGRSVEELSNTSHTILRSLGPLDRGAFERLRSLRTQLAALSLQGPGPLAPGEYQQRLQRLADQSDALAADLAKRSAPLRALSALPPPEDIIGRVASSLPKDSALIEFVAYQDRPLVPKPGTPPSKLSSQLRYQALVLFPDSRILTADLGPAAPIDRAVSTLRDALVFRDAAYRTPAQTLYSLVFKPLRPLLGDTRRLFLAPDGQLALVPFAALHDGKAFLIDSFDISYLTSGKDLLPRPQDTPFSDSVVVLADPAFTTPAPSAATGALSPVLRSPALERFFSTLRADVVEHPWSPLPGTRREAEAIQRLLPQAQLFLGSDATKQRLLELPSPAVLHIATHGFFLEDASAPAGSRALGSTGPAASSPRPADPLLRSGLVLSGARSLAPSASGTASPRPDSALVTALELAGMDLWGTQLVVLSACDTGRGAIKLGQGVYGLRRSLVVAGAETLVMSLLKVNDDSTHQLMEHFYQHLVAGQGRAAALQRAMLSVRKVQPHPSSWAPFISLGSDAPLRSLAPKPQQPPAP